jgi:hypothetical protein
LQHRARFDDLRNKAVRHIKIYSALVPFANVGDWPVIKDAVETVFSVDSRPNVEVIRSAVNLM